MVELHTIAAQSQVNRVLALGGQGAVHLLQQLLPAAYAVHVPLHYPLPIELCTDTAPPLTNPAYALVQLIKT